MMIATACATSGSSGSAAGRTCRSVLIFVRMLTAVAEALDLHNFSFFVLEQVGDRLRVLVGQLLHAFLRAVLVVLADFALGQVLQVLNSVPPNVSHRDPSFLRDLADDLDQLLPAL